MSNKKDQVQKSNSSKLKDKPKLTRISITVPEKTVEALDQKIVEEHYESRSQAIVDMINRHFDSSIHHRELSHGGNFNVVISAQYSQHPRATH